MKKFYPTGNTIFAQMAREEVTVNKIIEDDFFFSIFDIRPKAQTHVLVIPKFEFRDFAEFLDLADADLQYHVMQGIGKTARYLKLPFYNLVTNSGRGAGQEVFYLHFHLLSNHPVALEL